MRNCPVILERAEILSERSESKDFRSLASRDLHLAVWFTRRRGEQLELAEQIRQLPVDPRQSGAAPFALASAVQGSPAASGEM